MPDVMMSDGRMDERMKTADEICDLIHSTANIVRTAIMSEDPQVEKSLRAAAKAMLKVAVKKMDESVGTAVNDEEDE